MTFAETAPAVAAKLALDEPAGTVTEPCTESWELLLERPTAAPLLGAALDSVTVQRVDCPEPKLVGLHVRLVKVEVATSWIVAVWDVLL